MGQRNLKDDGDYFMFYKVTADCEVHGEFTWYSWKPFYVNDGNEYTCSQFIKFGLHHCRTVLTNIRLVNATRLEIEDAPKLWRKQCDAITAKKLIRDFDGTPIERASQIISLANAMKRLAKEMEDWPDDWFERDSLDFFDKDECPFNHYSELIMEHSGAGGEPVIMSELPDDLLPPDEIPDVREANVEGEKGWDGQRPKAPRPRSWRSRTGEIAGLGRDDEWTREYEESLKEHDDPR